MVGFNGVKTGVIDTEEETDISAVNRDFCSSEDPFN